MTAPTPAPTSAPPPRTPSAFDATARPAGARSPYRIRSAETWNLVRTHYLRGESARALSERYGVSVSNIRRRAGDEGWTRRGHAEAVDHFRIDGPPPPAGASGAPAAASPASAAGGGFGEPYPGAPDAEPLEADEVSGPGAVSRLALAATARALRAGRYAEAERLGRLAETLARMAPLEDTPRPEPKTFEADDDPEYTEWCRNKADQRLDALAERFRNAGILEEMLQYSESEPSTGSSIFGAP